MKRVVFFIIMLLITVTVVASPKPKYTPTEMMRKHYGASDVIFRGTFTDNFKRATLDTTGEDGMLTGFTANIEAMCMINNSVILNDPKYDPAKAEYDSRPKFLRMSLDYNYFSRHESISVFPYMELGLQYAQSTTCNFTAPLLGTMRGYWYAGTTVGFNRQLDQHRSPGSSNEDAIHVTNNIGARLGTSLYSNTKYFTGYVTYYYGNTYKYTYDFEMGNLINNRYMFAAGITNNNPKVNVTYMTLHYKLGTNIKLIDNKLRVGINLGFTF